MTWWWPPPRRSASAGASTASRPFRSLYHALQGGESYDDYIADAEGDDDLVEFFKDVKEEETNRADRAKKLLADRLSDDG